MDALDSYREAYEPQEQWILRRSFLERNWDDFPPERRTRLLALAQCFQNMHILGCSYSARVMDEVNRMSVGLVEEKEKTKGLPFAKINFVKAAPLSVNDATSPLDAEDDDDSNEEDLCEDEVGKTIQKSNKTQGLSVKNTNISQRLKESDDDNDSEDDRPKLGFGISAIPRSKDDAWNHNVPATSDMHSNPKSFVFGKTTYERKLGFVKSASQEQLAGGEFQFGVPFKSILSASKKAGDFVFGNKDPSVDNSNASASTQNTFQFGTGKKDYATRLGFVKSSTVGERRKSDDLNRHMESTSLDEGPGRKSPRWERNFPMPFSAQLSLLNDLRMQLKEVRPSLRKARVEFVMLQVNMAVTASGWKLEITNGKQTVVKLHGVQIASGLDEPSAYENFIEKVFDPRQWRITQRDIDLVLEVGLSVTNTLGQDKICRQSLNEAGSSQAGAWLPSVNTRHVYSQIIRNLIEVRNTIWTPNFKSKVAMFGGASADVQSALNMAFQLTKLKPVRDAIVPGTFLKPEFNTFNQTTTCLLTFHGVILAEAVGKSKNHAKLTTAKKLYEILESRMKFEIIERDGRNWLKTSGSGQQDRRAQALPEQGMPVINATIRSEYRDLFLIRPARASADLQALIAIFASANGLALSFESDAMIRKGVTVQICRLTLPTESPLKFEGSGETKQVARRACIRAALEELIRNCFTIDIKQAIAEGAQEFNKDTMALDLESQAVQEDLGRQLDEDNVGYRLLRNMGWQGGGLGHGTGLIEPVMLKDSAGGRGLGYEGASAVSKRFKTHVASTLRVFLRETDVFDELKFSPSFSSVERKEIHTIARRLGK